MVLEVIQREIPLRGTGYLILRDCPEERLGEGLGKGMEKLKKAGAKQVLATSLPEGEPLHPGPVGVWRLTHVHDILSLEHPMGPDRPKSEGKLSLRPVKRSSDEKVYLELVNRAYFEVPYGRTVDAKSLHLQNNRCLLAWQGDQPVGACRLDLSERVPELVTLAIAPQLQRQGLGRALLRGALESLGNKAPACALTVSSLNAPALALFQSEGFAQTGVVTSWFEVV